MSVDVENPTERWVLDHAFLDGALEAARRADIVTLDVFDTALTRTFDSPVDVFAEVERRAVGRLGGRGTGFAAVREDAERDARGYRSRLFAAEEVTLDEIYAEIAKRLPLLAPDLGLVEQLEVETEAECLIGVSDVVELTRRLRLDGKRYAFVSDMYLPKAFIAARLGAAGYEGWTSLYVSSDTKLSKVTGRQFAFIKADLGGEPDLLHIGDDDWSDVAVPHRLGIRTLPYRRARSERRVAGALRTHIVPFSREKRRLALADRADPGVAVGAPATWHGLGRVLGGITVGGFLRWLVGRAAVHGITDLYFCARDGWLVHEGWKAADLSARTGIAAHYLSVARRPLNFASGYLDSTPSRLSPALLKFLSSTDGHTTVGVALNRLGLPAGGELERAMLARFGSPETELASAEETAGFEDVLRTHSWIVYERLKHSYETMLAYLEQERIGLGGRSAIVDMGWHGTMQRSLQNLLRHVPGSAPIAGFYYGLWPEAQSNRFGAGLMESAFSSEFISRWDQPEVDSAAEILEELHTAPHGTVTGYGRRDGAWEPVCAASPVEAEQYDRVIRHFQEGTVSAVRDLFTTGRSGSLELDALGPEVVVATLGAIFMSPSPEEVDLIGSVQHCTTFDHMSFRPFVAADCPTSVEAMKAVLLNGKWRPGTLKAWASATDGHRRSEVASVARETLRHFGERSLRQFG